MFPRLHVFGSLLLLAAVTARPAAAANPKLMLKLQDVPVAEAVKQLSQASGVSVILNDPSNQRGGNAQRDQKQSFDWNGVTFANALRQVCTKYLLQPNRGPVGYVLYPSFQAPAGAPAKKVGLVEKNGAKLWMRSISVNDYRRLDFVNANNNGSGNLNIELMNELGDGDAATIAGVANLTGRDDLGTVLAFDNPQSLNGAYNSAMYPDEWMGNVNLPAPHAKAKKLQWIEGDVMGYRSMKNFRVEVPLPLAGKYVRKDAGDMSIVVSRFRAAGAAAAGDDDEVDGLPKQPINVQQGGSSVRVRVYTPNQGSRVGSVQGSGSWTVQPYMIGASGKIYQSNRVQSTGWGDQQFSVNDSVFVFPAMEDQPVKLVWDLVERSEPVKLYTFRMTDIPLPEANTPQPRPRNARPGAPVATHPFFERGGGTLVSKVLVGDAAASGTMQIGLAAKAADGWGPTRWFEVILEENGELRLENIKPGTYRLQRVFRPREGEAGPKGGAWANEDVTVSFVATKEATAAPLRWSLKPLPAPVKPPVKKAIVAPGK
jgi:hypothetical protein